MATKITISIPEPCHENWQTMTVVDKGRFCASCQKNVIDFTTASDRQIIETFNKTNHLCGRFNASQLNRELIVPKEKNPIWLATTAEIISFLSLGNQTITAQEKNTTEQTDKKVISKNSNPINTREEREITGTVSDIIGVLPSVNVVVKGTDRKTQTNLEGKFSLQAKENETLVFSYIGMETKEMIVDKSYIYNVRLKNDLVIMLTGTVGGAMLCKKRTFFGRIFHKKKYLLKN